MYKRISECWALVVVPAMAAVLARYLFVFIGLKPWPVYALIIGVAGYYAMSSNRRWQWFFYGKQDGVFVWRTTRSFMLRHLIACAVPVLIGIEAARVVRGFEPLGSKPRVWLARWEELPNNVRLSLQYAVEPLSPKTLGWLADTRHRFWTQLVLPIAIGVAVELLIVALSKPTNLLDRDDEGSDPGDVRRGRVRLTQRQAERIADSERARSDFEHGRQQPHPGIFWGGVFLPPEAPDLGFLTIGAPGMGKSVSMMLVAQGVLTGMGQGRPIRALWNDWKVDALPLLSALGLPWKTLHPEDTRGVGWDVAKDITTAKQARALVNVLFPKTETQSADEDYFQRGARAVAKAVVITFVETCAGKWTLHDVIHALRNRRRLEAVLDRTAQGREVKELYLTKEKTFLDLLSTLANLTDDYLEIAAAWERAAEKISIRDWVRGNYVLVLGNSATEPEIYKRLNAVIFKRASQLLLKELPQDGSEQTWIFLDELSQMGKIDGLHALAREGRSRGVTLVLGLQDVEGLEDELGEKKAHEVLGMCRNVAVFAVGSAHTAEFVAKLFGQKEVEEERISYTSSRGPDGKSSSTSTNTEVATREAVLASQFMNLPAPKKAGGLIGYFLSPHVGAWRAFVPFSYLHAALAKPDPNVEAFQERPAEDLRPRPWTPADTQRLGLPAALATETVDENAGGNNKLDPDKRRRLRDAGNGGHAGGIAP